jgi:hypothetical protein
MTECVIDGQQQKVIDLLKVIGFDVSTLDLATLSPKQIIDILQKLLENLSGGNVMPSGFWYLQDGIDILCELINSLLSPKNLSLEILSFQRFSPPTDNMKPKSKDDVEKANLYKIYAKNQINGLLNVLLAYTSPEET